MKSLIFSAEARNTAQVKTSLLGEVEETKKAVYYLGKATRFTLLRTARMKKYEFRDSNVRGLDPTKETIPSWLVVKASSEEHATAIAGHALESTLPSKEAQRNILFTTELLRIPYMFKEDSFVLHVEDLPKIKGSTGHEPSLSNNFLKELNYENAMLLDNGVLFGLSTIEAKTPNQGRYLKLVMELKGVVPQAKNAGRVRTKLTPQEKDNFSYKLWLPNESN